MRLGRGKPEGLGQGRCIGAGVAGEALANSAHIDADGDQDRQRLRVMSGQGLWIDFKIRQTSR